jgi:acyl-CoA thioesterase-1
MLKTRTSVSKMKDVKPAGFLAIVSVVAAGLSVAGCKSSPTSAASTSVLSTTQAAPARFTPAPAAASEATTDARPLILCFGDSLTAGYGTDPGQSYPDQLQLLLDAKGYPYRVVNSGVSGNTTKDGIDRIEHVLKRLDGHPGSIAVIEFGGNDGLRGLPLEQTKTNLAQMIDEFQHAGAKVALAGITLPPDYGRDYIAKLVAIYPALAKQYRVPLLPFLLQDVYGVPGDMQDDATHATAKGNKQVALNVEKLITPLLKR